MVITKKMLTNVIVKLSWFWSFSLNAILAGSCEVSLLKPSYSLFQHLDDLLEHMEDIVLKHADTEVRKKIFFPITVGMYGSSKHVTTLDLTSTNQEMPRQKFFKKISKLGHRWEVFKVRPHTVPRHNPSKSVIIRRYPSDGVLSGA